MPKDEWGVKRLCPSCSSRFYDLNRDPMTCPMCGTEFDLDSLLARKGGTRFEKKDADPVAVTSESTSEEEDIVLDDDEETPEDVDIDDELLEDDDDNVDLEEIADVPAEDEDN